MQKWTSTTDTRVAAAMGTLGMVIRPKPVLDDVSGRRVTRFFMGTTSEDGDYLTREILNAWDAGTLPAAHPFVTCLRAFVNWNALLDLANRAAKIELQEVLDAPGIWQYVPGDRGLAGLGGELAVFKTGDAKLVAALGLVGLPLLKIEGPKGARVFYVRNFTLRPGGWGPVDAMRVAAAWHKDKASIPWVDPLAQALRMLYNRERLLDIINNRVPELVLLRRGKRSAVVRADATDAAWDKAERFLG